MDIRQVAETLHHDPRKQNFDIRASPWDFQDCIDQILNVLLKNYKNLL